jgi:hypothetical protein
MQFVVLIVVVGVLMLAGLELWRRAAAGSRMERALRALQFLGDQIEYAASQPADTSTRRQAIGYGSAQRSGDSPQDSEAA